MPIHEQDQGCSIRQRGFVLPYVLTAIAILSIAVTIAAQRLQSTSAMIVRIQEETESEIAFMNAEVETLYAFLIGSPVEGGINLAPVIEVAEPSLNGVDEVAEVDLWSGAGETRIVDTFYGPVLVSYQDVSGLVSINATNEKIIEKFIISLDVKPTTARSMAATLADYRDPDHQRRFQGGERADYRLRKLPPPANSPLRSYSELGNVLYWPDGMKNIDLYAFMDQTTIALGAGFMKHASTDSKLLDTMGLNSMSMRQRILDSSIESFIAGDSFPTNRARFILSYRNPAGRYKKRVIEIERKLNNPDKPFEKFWVYQTTVLEGSENAGFGQIDELKNVFYSPSYRSK